MISGIVPIVVTPFDDKDQIDYASLERLLEDYCRNEVSGIVVPAVASEVGKLSADERTAMIRATARIVGGRVPVIGGVLGDSAAAAARLAEDALQAGCRGILCRAAESIADNLRALESYFHAVADAGADWMVIQDLSWGNFGMEIDLILRLFEAIPAFRTIKIEVARTGYKATRLFAATDSQLHVWSGWAMPQMVEALERGIQGFCPSAFNRPFVRIFRMYHQGEHAAATDLFETVLPYLAWSRQHIDINLHLLKRLCVRKGLFRTARLRPPAMDYDRFHESYGQTLIERMLAWERL